MELLNINRRVFGDKTTIKVLGIKRFVVKYRNIEDKNPVLENRFLELIKDIKNTDDIEFYGFV